ncbi:hypothetical protein [uncultured Cohaesibacter sp.]|uniref:hypothetical protein n=1 Tax=uncultured Cohaesibacter sp. TaxID=1002546 RepID=UPI002AABD23C|nr:hypothetical protein [uncultured Cohaesibacter sp.]
MSDEINTRLGRIEGLMAGMDSKLDGISGRLDGQDARLRDVEVKASKNSFMTASVTSGVVAVGIAFFKDKLGI